MCGQRVCTLGNRASEPFTSHLNYWELGNVGERWSVAAAFSLFIEADGGREGEGEEGEEKGREREDRKGLK